VDVALLFDVLLHQVDPDWDAVLARWAPHVRAFAIAEPLLAGVGETVRLVDLGRERYLELVPRLDLHDALFDRLDEVNERRGRPWRDVHDVWQWGIAAADLRARLAALGFREAHHEDGGPWQGHPAWRHEAFVFVRD
jgi:hypothetical protein